MRGMYCMDPLTARKTRGCVTERVGDQKKVGSWPIFPRGAHACGQNKILLWGRHGKRGCPSTGSAMGHVGEWPTWLEAGRCVDPQSLRDL